MKKLLTLSAILLSLFSAAQFPVLQRQGSVNTLTDILGGLRTGKGIIVATYADTGLANLSHISKYPYAVIGVGNKLLMRNSTATAWIGIGTGGGTGLQDVIDFDNRLTKNDTVNASGRRFLFDSTAAFGAGYNLGMFGDGTFLAGRGSVVTGQYSGGWGYDNNISGSYSSAFGRGNLVSGGYSIASGEANQALGHYSSAFGRGNLVYQNSIASGYYNQVTGYASAAFGELNTAANSKTFVAGWQSAAYGNISIAMGHVSRALGDGSAAIGYTTLAKGHASTALGVNSSALTNHSSVLGDGLMGKSYGGTSVGHYNDSLDNSNQLVYDANGRAFQVGIGTSNADRRNAVTVLNNGKVGIGTTNPQAVLDISSSTGGVVFPRMNTQQMITMPSPVQGTIIYNTDSLAYTFYNGSTWLNVADGGVVTGTNLQQALNNGSALTRDNTINAQGHKLAIDNLQGLSAGTNTKANGEFSVATNLDTRTDGIAATATGHGSISKSYAGTVIGSFNDSTNAASTDFHNPDNRVLQVGIGTDNANRKNAVTVFQNGEVAIGGVARDPSLILDVTSSTQGVRFPQMTNAQIAAIVAPKAGTLVYNTDKSSYVAYNGVEWQSVGKTNIYDAIVRSRAEIVAMADSVVGSVIYLSKSLLIQGRFSMNPGDRIVIKRDHVVLDGLDREYTRVFYQGLAAGEYFITIDAASATIKNIDFSSASDGGAIRIADNRVSTQILSCTFINAVSTSTPAIQFGNFTADGILAGNKIVSNMGIVYVNTAHRHIVKDNYIRVDNDHLLKLEAVYDFDIWNNTFYLDGAKFKYAIAFSGNIQRIDIHQNTFENHGDTSLRYIAPLNPATDAVTTLMLHGNKFQNPSMAKWVSVELPVMNGEVNIEGNHHPGSTLILQTNDMSNILLTSNYGATLADFRGATISSITMMNNLATDTLFKLPATAAVNGWTFLGNNSDVFIVRGKTFIEADFPNSASRGNIQSNTLANEFPWPTGATGGGAGGNLPVGTVIMYPSATPPAGFLLMDGSTFDAVKYPALNTFLGGNTLPDMRNQFVRGAGGTRVPLTTQSYATAMARNPFTTGQAGAHNHAGNTGTWNGSTVTTDNPGNHSHSFSVAIEQQGGGLRGRATVNNSQGTITTDPAGAHTHQVPIPAHNHTIPQQANHNHPITGGDAETRPDNIALAFMIKAEDSKTGGLLVTDSVHATKAFNIANSQWVTKISNDGTMAQNSVQNLVTEQAVRTFVLNTLTSEVKYRGAWNAATNTPAITDATGTKGDMYVVSQGATIDLGHGAITVSQGGFIIHDGTQFDFVGADNLVQAVNGMTGMVAVYPVMNGDTLRVNGDNRYVLISDIPVIAQIKTDVTNLRNDITSIERQILDIATIINDTLAVIKLDINNLQQGLDGLTVYVDQQFAAANQYVQQMRTDFNDSLGVIRDSLRVHNGKLNPTLQQVLDNGNALNKSSSIEAGANNFTINATTGSIDLASIDGGAGSILSMRRNATIAATNGTISSTFELRPDSVTIKTPNGNVFVDNLRATANLNNKRVMLYNNVTHEIITTDLSNVGGVSQADFNAIKDSIDQHRVEIDANAANIDINYNEFIDTTNDIRSDVEILKAKPDLWTKTGTGLHPTTQSDEVLIGGATDAGNYKLQVEGGQRVSNGGFFYSAGFQDNRPFIIDSLNSSGTSKFEVNVMRTIADKFVSFSIGKNYNDPSTYIELPANAFYNNFLSITHGRTDYNAGILTGLSQITDPTYPKWFYGMTKSFADSLHTSPSSQQAGSGTFGGISEFDGTRFRHVLVTHPGTRNVTIGTREDFGYKFAVRGTTLLQGTTVVNDLGADADFRVEGDTDPNLLFADASVDRVYIGIPASGPANHKLGVHGNILTDAGVFANAGNGFYLYETGLPNQLVGHLGNDGLYVSRTYYALPQLAYFRFSEHRAAAIDKNLGLVTIDYNGKFFDEAQVPQGSVLSGTALYTSITSAYNSNGAIRAGGHVVSGHIVSSLQQFTTKFETGYSAVTQSFGIKSSAINLDTGVWNRGAYAFYADTVINYRAGKRGFAFYARTGASRLDSVGIANDNPEYNLDISGTTRLNGGIIRKIRDVAASGNVLPDDYIVNVTAAGQTMTLPTAVGRRGQEYVFNGTVTLTAAGAELIEGNNSITLNDPVIVSNGTGWEINDKRWTARVGSVASAAVPAINTNNFDIFKITAQTADITGFTLTGTPKDGDILEVQITGTAGNRKITWGTSFASSSVTLPDALDGTNTLTCVFQYFSTSSYGNNKWVIANYF